MSGPPDIEPSELFLKLLERPKPSAVFPFPRTDDHGEPVFDVRVFVLNERELGECKMAARRWGQEKLKDGVGIIAEMDKDSLGDRLAKEILARSVHEDRVIGGTDDMVGGPKYHRMFAGADDIDELTADELALLYGAYRTAQQHFGPTDHSFEDEGEVNSWIAKLQEGGGHFLLSLLQSHQRDALLLRVVQRATNTYSVIEATIKALEMDSLPPSLEKLLEYIQETWLVGIDSSTSLAAEYTDSQSKIEPTIIDPDEAVKRIRAAQAEAAANRTRAVSRAQSED